MWRASSTRRLVAVTCYEGAYQGVAMLYLVDPAHESSGPLAPHLYADLGNGRLTLTRDRQILGDLTLAPRTGTLRIFDKFRGPADCGVLSTFRLEGRALVPTAVHAKLACDGRPPYDASRWPRLPVPTQ